MARRIKELCKIMQVKVLYLPAVPLFSISDHRTLAQRCEKWTKSLDYIIISVRLALLTRNKNVLFYCTLLSPIDVQEIFETLPNNGEEYMTALEKLKGVLSTEKRYSV